MGWSGVEVRTHSTCRVTAKVRRRLWLQQDFWLAVRVMVRVRFRVRVLQDPYSNRPMGKLKALMTLDTPKRHKPLVTPFAGRPDDRRTSLHG